MKTTILTLLVASSALADPSLKGIRQSKPT
jgi:hypothetical protein